MPRRASPTVAMIRTWRLVRATRRLLRLLTTCPPWSWVVATTRTMIAAASTTTTPPRPLPLRFCGGQAAGLLLDSARRGKFHKPATIVVSSVRKSVRSSLTASTARASCRFSADAVPTTRRRRLRRQARRVAMPTAIWLVGRTRPRLLAAGTPIAADVLVHSRFPAFVVASPPSSSGGARLPLLSVATRPSFRRQSRTAALPRPR